MRVSFTSAALVGVSCISSLVAAAPLTTHYGTNPSSNTSEIKLPLGNGFPTPNPTAVLDIQDQAQGTLPNGAAPSPISAEGKANLRLLAFNEIFETAFFTQLLANVTNNITGFREEDMNGFKRSAVIEMLTATQAQEELHALDVNGALAANKEEIIVGCTYNFNVHDFQEAIATAATFTDVVLGTLQDVNQIFAEHGDSGLVRAISSVISQEGEQDAYYRILQTNAHKNPNALPFISTATRNFAYTAILENVVANTCEQSNITAIEKDLHSFIPLKVETTPIYPGDQDLTFSFSLTTPDAEMYRQAQVVSGFNMVYLNQQNIPVVQPIKFDNITDDRVYITSHFPYKATMMNGLTIAAIAPGDNFTDADDVANKALIAPGLIEIN